MNPQNQGDALRVLEKEAGILNSVKGDRNISGFLSFCLLPYAFVMAYSCFDFDVWLVDFSLKRD